MENCATCSEAGKEGCDSCAAGYYFDLKTGLCEDDSCRIKHCEVCSASGPYGCDKCYDGYYVNQLLGICKSTACIDDFCFLSSTRSIVFKLRKRENLKVLMCGRFNSMYC